MNKKAFLAALAVGITGFVLLVVYIRRFQDEASGGAPVPVVVALRDIPLGSILTEDMLGVRDLPQSYVEERHVRMSEYKRIIGVRVSSALRANETLLWTDLAASGEQKRDLSGLIEDGMRAVTIRANITSSFGGLLRPGDRVDVMLTYEPQPAKKWTLPLLQNVLVLAIGTDLGGRRFGEKREGSASQVVLSVRADKAPKLAQAHERGVITLVLRNPNDIEEVQGLPSVGDTDLRTSESAPPPESPTPNEPSEGHAETHP